MYYNKSFDSFLSNNIAIIGNRESGKTTLLEKIIEFYTNNNYSIILFDSATDHKTKSLLVKISKKFSCKNIFLSPEKIDIVFSNINKHSYPFKELKKTTGLLYLFDVSKYLEEGFETENLSKRKKIRNLYKQLVFQILFVFFPLIKNDKYVIIMDEIELNKNMQGIIKNYNSKNIFFVAALHEEKNLNNSYHLFEKIYLEGGF